MGIETIAVWFATSVLAQDAFTRFINFVRGNHSEYRKLTKAVAQESGVRPGKAYKNWFMESDVWTNIVDNYDDERRDLLIKRLEAQISSTFRSRRTTRGLSTREQATALVDATLLTLIENLDPSRSTAIVGERLHSHITGIRSEIRDLAGLFAAKKDLSTLLRKIPPGARSILEKMYVDQPNVAAALINSILGSASSNIAVRELALNPPHWLTASDAQAWLFLAEEAHSFGDPSLASTLFEKVADLGLDRSTNLCRSALTASAAQDNERAHALLSKAEELGPKNPLAKVYKAAIRGGDAGEILAAAREIGQLGLDADCLIAQAIAIAEGPKAGITYFRRVISLYPDYAGPYLQLVRNYLSGAAQARIHFGSAERREMRELALTARNLRREWGGDSAEAVMYACEVALERGDWNDVLNLGRQDPDGEATEIEAEDPRVLHVVAEAALANGDRELAQELISSTADEFDRAFLEAKSALLFNDGSRQSIAARYHIAWKFARDATERNAVWMGLAAIGADLPERGTLETSNDVHSALILGRHEASNDQLEDALSRLRPWRNRSPLVIEMIAAIYIEKNDIDSAAEVLERAATRFGDPRFRARAAQVLADYGELAKAEEIAVQALASLGDDPILRRTLHEIRISSAQERKTWREMEEHIRTLIDEQGSTETRRWYLSGALFNQRMFQASWDVLQEEPKLEPTSAERALMWIDLATKFRFDERLAQEILSLLERHGAANADFSGQVIGRLVLWAHEANLSAYMTERLRVTIAEFIENNPEHSSFRAISIPEDADADTLKEVFRQFLEPGTATLEDLRRQVGDLKAPYGMLSALTGKPYSSTLAHRAAGCLPIWLPVDDIEAQEKMAASEAIESAIVLDASTLAICYFLRDIWPAIISSFTQVVIPLEARSDIIHAVQSFLLPSDGSLGWNAQAGAPSMSDADPVAQTRLRSHSQWMLSATEDLDVTDWPTIQTLRDTENWNEPERFLPWLTPLDFAATNDVVLFADDAALRMIGRSIGVRCFGTVALLQVLLEARKITQVQFNYAQDAMRREFCVDLPLDPIALNRILEQDSWSSAAVPFAFSRPTAWRIPSTLRTWSTLLAHLIKENPSDLAYWLYCATIGVTKEKNSNDALKAAAHLLFVASTLSGLRSEVVKELLRASREALALSSFSDVLPHLIAVIRELLTQDFSEQDRTRIILALSVELDEEDRSIVRQLLIVDS
ncbi:hypothetical protein ABT256_18185 [Amycolatopsis japonica]|uniref:tetratricopeptide repeat protein n=1 Tax=Amycolatopsis japonica TaxID=208439 RepID=UPI00331B28E8